MHAARLPAKLDAVGDLNALSEQDRSRWDARLAAEGLRLFERSAAGLELSAYHLEAAIAAGAWLVKVTRLGFLALLVSLLVIGARLGEASWTSFLAVTFGSVGLYASELGQLGVPGIWFPFGVGVSRTEYAYAAFTLVLFVYLLQRLWRFVPARLAT